MREQIESIVRQGAAAVIACPGTGDDIQRYVNHHLAVLPPAQREAIKDGDVRRIIDEELRRILSLIKGGQP